MPIIVQHYLSMGFVDGKSHELISVATHSHCGFKWVVPKESLFKPFRCPQCSEMQKPKESSRTGRPSQYEIFMELARQFARRSTCRRAAVGTVVASVDFRKVLAVGHNGNASGLSNDCDRDEPGNCGCLHAEENACIHCDCPRETPKIVFTTTLPCPACAKRLINLGGVKKVVYDNPYRFREAESLFVAAGIKMEEYRGPT